MSLSDVIVLHCLNRCTLFELSDWQVERERSLKSKALLEKEEYRAHIHKLVRTLRRHQVCCGVLLNVLCPIHFVVTSRRN